MTRFHELRFSKREVSMQTLLLETLLNTLWMIDGYQKTLWMHLMYRKFQNGSRMIHRSEYYHINH